MVRLTDCPDMTLDVYRGRKTTLQQQQKCYVESYQAVKHKKGHIKEEKWCRIGPDGVTVCF